MKKLRKKQQNTKNGIRLFESFVVLGINIGLFFGSTNEIISFYTGAYHDWIPRQSLYIWRRSWFFEWSRNTAMDLQYYGKTKKVFAYFSHHFYVYIYFVQLDVKIKNISLITVLKFRNFSHYFRNYT